MIQEILIWIESQNVWVEPIFKFIILVAAIKYIFFGK